MPLGYDVIDRKLVVNKVEAEQVRHIMQLYLKVSSVPDLAEVLAKNGSHTKTHSEKMAGRGCHFKSGNLYHLLSNRIYRGMTVHKGEAFDGEHGAIVSEELWNKIQAQLAKQGQGGSSRKVSARTGVLAGLIYNAEGTAMVLTHTQKGNRRFHYYANRYETLGDSTASRINARDIEDIVGCQLAQALASGRQIQNMLKTLHTLLNNSTISYPDVASLRLKSASPNMSVNRKSFELCSTASTFMKTKY